jgi:hypothetical protein
MAVLASVPDTRAEVPCGNSGLMAEVVIPPKRANGISIQLRVRGGDAVFDNP